MAGGDPQHDLKVGPRGWRLLERLRGQRLVVGVSGGGDSVALLRWLDALAPRWGLSLVVAHLNHQARGAESDADAAFVAALGERLGWPCVIGSWKAEGPSGFEDAARRARLDWLGRVAMGQGAVAVALGHTADDQAETVLHRVIRGTGLRGLAGIPHARPLVPGVVLIRPLLEIRREALRTYLRSLGQDWREDATNAGTDRTRIWIRNELLPLLEQRGNPRVVAALTRLAQVGGAGHRRFARRLERLADGAIQEAASARIVLDARRLEGLPVLIAAEVLRLAWRRAGWPLRAMAERHWRAVIELRAGGRIAVPGAEARRVGRQITIEPWHQAAKDPGPARGLPESPLALPLPGAVRWGGFQIEAGAGEARAAWSSETIDADRLEPFQTATLGPGLQVRTGMPGDRFAPLGMDGHEQALGEFLRGRGVPADARGRVPLVCDQTGIVWVVGHRIAERVRIGPQTTTRLGLTADRVASGGGG
jgi:tRNA(Ile)-lysidine synthase